jgi:acyl-CoA dehydrogenase
MVDFTLTDEQKALRELAHDFAKKEIRPVAWEYDRIEEEIAWSCSEIGTSLSANGLAAAPVYLGASDEVKQEYFEKLIDSPKLASLTEPNAGHRGISADAVRRLDEVHVDELTRLLAPAQTSH